MWHYLCGLRLSREDRNFRIECTRTEHVLQDILDSCVLSPLTYGLHIYTLTTTLELSRRTGTISLSATVSRSKKQWFQVTFGAFSIITQPLMFAGHESHRKPKYNFIELDLSSAVVVVGRSLLHDGSQCLWIRPSVKHSVHLPS